MVIQMTVLLRNNLLWSVGTNNHYYDCTQAFLVTLCDRLQFVRYMSKIEGYKYYSQVTKSDLY